MMTAPTFLFFLSRLQRHSRAGAVILLCATALVLPPSTPLAATAPSSPQGITDPFPQAIAKAMKGASRAYRDAETLAPDSLRDLSEEQWRSIRFNPEYAPWRHNSTPFAVSLFHPGFLFNRTVAVNVVTAEGIKRLPRSPEMFTYGSKTLAEKMRQAAPGAAGFQIAYPLNDALSHEPVVFFLGASYFRAVGRHSRPGLHARALALNTALPEGEEFPHFREFWLVTPKAEDTTLTVCALMDSPSVTGAFRYAITPGTSTIMDVEARIFLRKGGVWPQKVGLAPLTSMFLYSETGNGWPGDYRPEVHSSDGLLFSAGQDQWTWSPLANPARLAVNTFSIENPRGFGLMQRDADFDHYQDIQERFDRRPSLWVEPQGEWGPGRIELVLIPSSEEIHENIVAFWVPDPPDPDASTENTQTLSLAYRLYWMTPGVTPHALGRVAATRVVKREDTARFIIDFEGETLRAVPAETGLASLIQTPENTPIIEKHLVKNPVTGGWRLSFSVRLPRQDTVVRSIIAAREGSPRLRFRALLKKGENLPAPLTEEWVYDLPS